MNPEAVPECLRFQVVADDGTMVAANGDFALAEHEWEGWIDMGAKGSMYRLVDAWDDNHIYREATA